jgi:hypothetical protein
MPVTSKLQAHFRRVTGQPALAFLRFHYQQPVIGGRRGGAEGEQSLRLDEQSNVVFSGGGLSSSGERNAFEIQESRILLQQSGVYLFVIHYEHTHENVTLDARLPFESGELRSFLLHGARNSLYRHCVVSRPQNISVAVYSGLPDRAQHVNFRSLLLEVTRLGHDLPKPLRLSSKSTT